MLDVLYWNRSSSTVRCSAPLILFFLIKNKHNYYLYFQKEIATNIISSWSTQAGFQKPLSAGYILNAECYINVSKYRIVKM